MKFVGNGISSMGSREINQDAYRMSFEKGLFAVADGVGGGKSGEIAASLVVEEFLEKAQGIQSLRSLLTDLHQLIVKTSLELWNDTVMGTTFTGIRCREGKVQLVHVGDSRGYLIRGTQILQLTNDHEAYSKRHNRPYLASFLGTANDSALRVDEKTIPLEPGDRLLLSTDGLHGQLEFVTLQEILAAHADHPASCLEKLVAAAEQNDDSDNITAVLLEAIPD